MGRISARRMKAAFFLWLPTYHKNQVTPHVKMLLTKMSSATLERFLSKIRKSRFLKTRGLSGTTPSFLKNQIPIVMYQPSLIVDRVRVFTGRYCRSL